MKKSSTRLKVLVSMPPTYSPLYQDIDGQPDGYRSDRLRQLASIGLLVCRGQFGPVAGMPAHSVSPADQPPDSCDDETRSVIRGILG